MPRLLALALLLPATFYVPASAQQANSSTPDSLSKKQQSLLGNESGFLGNTYAKLAPDPTDKNWLIYFRSPGVLRGANTFLLEKVQVFLVPDAQKRDIDPAQLDKLAETFTNAIRDELTKAHYNLVDQPGPGVLTLRFAITDVQPNGGKTNMAVTGTEAVATHAVLPGAGELIPRIKVGKASIEGEVLDSQSHQVEMAFMTSKSGRRFFSGLNAFKKWGDIDRAFRIWAKDFRERLDKAHAQAQ